MWPGSGAVLAAVETATGRKADAIVGKPEPAMYEAARDRLGEGKILALGDRLDVRRARRQARRASTPRSCSPASPTRAQVDGATPAPTHVGDSLAALLLDVRRRRHQTHHKHSSTKGYRRLLDRLAAHEDVHRVATGRVKPRMGTGRPIAPISKVRQIESGLSITINADGAVIDAFVVTSDPEGVAAWLREEGLAK